jgi:hypothetical protein
MPELEKVDEGKAGEVYPDEIDPAWADQLAEPPQGAPSAADPAEGGQATDAPAQGDPPAG